MPQEIVQPSRPWRQIAKELVHETNRQRVTELSEELSRAVDEQMYANSVPGGPPVEQKYFFRIHSTCGA